MGVAIKTAGTAYTRGDNAGELHDRRDSDGSVLRSCEARPQSLNEHLLLAQSGLTASKVRYERKADIHIW